MLLWKPEFWTDLHQNLMQTFPQPNDASDKIWLRLANWSQRYLCLNVWTDWRWLDLYTISSPCEPSAQVS